MNEQWILSGEQVRKHLEKADVFWLYTGEPRKDAPHALLTSGKHSDGYVNVGQVLKERPDVRRAFIKGILAALRKEWSGNIDRVVGADTSSTDLAEGIASIAGADHIRMLKTEDSEGKRQVWYAKNTPLHNGEIVLHIEELVTTSSSALQVREGIRRANPEVIVNFVPYLPVVVERSDPNNRVIVVEDSKILPLLQLSIRNYEPNLTDCPYCAAGSQALKPKIDNNWSLLTSTKG